MYDRRIYMGNLSGLLPRPYLKASLGGVQLASVQPLPQGCVKPHINQILLFLTCPERVFLNMVKYFKCFSFLLERENASKLQVFLFSTTT